MSSESEYKHVVRIAGRDLDGSKKVYVALTDFRGIGYNMAFRITRAMGIDRRQRLGFLDEHKLREIEETVKNAARLGLPI